MSLLLAYSRSVSKSTLTWIRRPRMPVERMFTWLSRLGARNDPRHPELGSTDRAGLHRSSLTRSVRISRRACPSRVRSAYLEGSPSGFRRRTASPSASCSADWKGVPYSVSSRMPTARSARSAASVEERVLSNAADRRPGVLVGAPIQGALRTAGCCRVSAGCPKPGRNPGVVVSDWAARAWGSQHRQPRATSNRVTPCKSMRDLEE